MFEALITRCLTSALISIHEPLIFVTKSIRLVHFRGEKQNNEGHSHRTSQALTGVSHSRHLSLQPLNDELTSQTHAHTHTDRLHIVFMQTIRGRRPQKSEKPGNTYGMLHLFISGLLIPETSL